MSPARGTYGPLLAELDLPLPGRGATLARWRDLARLTARNVVTGRLAEAHADAVAITTDLGAPELVAPGTHWGVWAAEPPSPRLYAAEAGGSWTLSGTKPWCSGASLCTHALVTATVDGDGGAVALFAVDLRRPGVRAVPDTWPAVGMADSDSGWVELSEVPARRLGSHADYLDRPGFWHGGAGVAACWFGGAAGVAAPLLARAARPGASELVRAHAGATAAELAAGWALLTEAAATIDADPDDRAGLRTARALSVRTRIDRLATTVIARVGRGLGAGPLCADGEHARRVADLGVYIRQTHAEADEAQIAAAVAARAEAGEDASVLWGAIIGFDPNGGDTPERRPGAGMPAIADGDA
ncbi:acyl-CoA dehydrogenase family protein [Georgenia sp. Z1491]|uniref:acyl-CoA dehydrogenase family protein n=1 Tax=Georgenia sp. Z1491 TaxID=3416707 RepID=UPI003CEEBEC7